MYISQRTCGWPRLRKPAHATRACLVHPVTSGWAGLQDAARSQQGGLFLALSFCGALLDVSAGLQEAHPQAVQVLGGTVHLLGASGTGMLMPLKCLQEAARPVPAGHSCETTSTFSVGHDWPGE